jgi:hypothetical protein
VNLIKEKEKLYNSNIGGNKSKEFQNINFNNPIKSKIKFKNKKNEKYEISNKQEDNNISNSHLNIESNNSYLLNNSSENSYDKIKEQLEKKTILYERLKSTKQFEDKEMMLIKESSSIDFDMKRIEEKDNRKKLKLENFNLKNEEIYDSSRNLANVIKAENEFLDNNFFSNSKFSNNLTHAKQSYDKVLTQDEKKALIQVKIEETDYKSKLELLKRKKNIEREERIERIKKMKTGE